MFAKTFFLVSTIVICNGNSIESWVSKSEAKKLVQTADKKSGGLIDYEAFSNNLLPQSDKEALASASVDAAKNVEKEKTEPTNEDTNLCW